MIGDICIANQAIMQHATGDHPTFLLAEKGDLLWEIDPCGGKGPYTEPSILVVDSRGQKFWCLLSEVDRREMQCPTFVLSRELLENEVEQRSSRSDRQLAVDATMMTGDRVVCRFPNHWSYNREAEILGAIDSGAYRVRVGCDVICLLARDLRPVKKANRS